MRPDGKQHRTQLGRVVYHRKPHIWSEKDLDRILRYIDARQRIQNPFGILELLSKKMIATILSGIGLERLTDEAYQALYGLVDRLLRLLVDQGRPTPTLSNPALPAPTLKEGNWNGSEKR